MYFHISITIDYSTKPNGFTSSVIFDGIEEALKKDGKNLVGKVKGIFAFKVKKADGELDFKDKLSLGVSTYQQKRCKNVLNHKYLFKLF